MCTILRHSLNEDVHPIGRKDRSLQAEAKEFGEAGCQLESTVYKDNRRHFIGSISLLRVKTKEGLYKPLKILSLSPYILGVHKPLKIL